MNTIDLDAIRAQRQRALDRDLWHPALDDIGALLAEVDRLAATVERVEDLVTEWEQRCEYYRGTGNFRTHRYATDELQAAIEGTDS